MTTRAGTILLVVVTAVAAVVSGAQSAQAADLGCSDRDRSQHTTGVGSIDASLRPLVLVHGWTGTSDAMGPVEAALEDRLPNTFAFRYFDYRNANTDWAAHNRVASCLANYLHEVSDAHKDAGGDGRVHVVAHSMGGLAVRFATDSDYTDRPVPASMLAGVTTIATPHLGSPWGNSIPASIKQWWDELNNSELMAYSRSDAVHCLALHDRNRRLPSDCATPPYLPNGVRVDQVSGDNAVRRTVFGITLYDIDLRSDGIVGADSATGYLLGSGPPGSASPRAKVSDTEVGCTVTSDQTIELLRSFKGKLPAGIIEAELKAIGLFGHDSAVLDEINSGRMGVNLAVMLLVAALTYDCAHSSLLDNTDAMNAVAAALEKQAEQTATVDATRFWSDSEGGGYFFTTQDGQWRCAIRPSGPWAGCNPSTPDRVNDMGIAGAPRVPTAYDPKKQTLPNYILIDSETHTPRFGHSSNALFWKFGGPTEVLKNGQVLAALGFTCNIQEAEVSCKEDSSGHGFTFSHAGYAFEYTS